MSERKILDALLAFHKIFSPISPRTAPIPSTQICAPPKKMVLGFGLVKLLSYLPIWSNFTYKMAKGNCKCQALNRDCFTWFPGSPWSRYNCSLPPPFYRWGIWSLAMLNNSLGESHLAAGCGHNPLVEQLCPQTLMPLSLMSLLSVTVDTPVFLLNAFPAQVSLGSSLTLDSPDGYLSPVLFPFPLAFPPVPELIFSSNSPM